MTKNTLALIKIVAQHLVTKFSLSCTLMAALAIPFVSEALAQQDFDSVVVEAYHVQGNVYVLTGAGANVTLQIGDDGALIVDTQFEAMAGKILAKIEELAGDIPLRYILNTHAHADHTAGNEALRIAGETIFGGNVEGDDPRGEQGATVIAHENVLLQMALASGDDAVPFEVWPTESYIDELYDLYFNGEAVQLYHPLAAHTDGDSIIFFRKSDVISTGDIYVTTSYPLIDQEHGGHINGIIDALNQIITLTVPREKQEGGTMVIPGHGRISDEADVVEYRDMLTIIRDRIETMIEEGKTLQQVQALRPSRDYDGRYGAAEGRWTTEMFIAAIYRGLSE